MRSTPASASISCASRALRPSRSRPRKPNSSARMRPERARALADLLDRLSARLGARAVTRRELIEAHLPEQAEAAAPAALGEARSRGEGLETGASGAPARPLRLFVRPEPIEALAEVPDGPPLRFRWRRVLHDVAAIEGPERIAAPWWRRAERADARLFPRRGFSRPPLLALSRRALWPRDGAGEMVCARGVRVKEHAIVKPPFAPLAGRRWPRSGRMRGGAELSE